MRKASCCYQTMKCHILFCLWLFVSIFHFWNVAFYDAFCSFFSLYFGWKWEYLLSQYFDRGRRFNPQKILFSDNLSPSPSSAHLKNKWCDLVVVCINEDVRMKSIQFEFGVNRFFNVIVKCSAMNLQTFATEWKHQFQNIVVQTATNQMGIDAHFTI